MPQPGRPAADRQAIGLRGPSRTDQSARLLIPVDKEVVEGFVGIDALRTEHDIQPRQRGCLHVMPAKISQARKRQTERRRLIVTECIRPVPLRHHLVEQPLLRAEVIQQPCRRHSNAIPEGGQPRSAVSLRSEQLNRRVEDLPSTKVPTRLAISLISSRSASCSRGAHALSASARSTFAEFVHQVIGITFPYRRQKCRGAMGAGPSGWNWR